MKEKLPNRFIFSINCGRSGSQYLYKLFQHVPDCIACHEKKPIGNGRAMRKFLNGKESEIEKIARNKQLLINQELQKYRHYIETNHCFIKGFGWKLMELLPNEQITIIILRRSKNKIVESLWRVGASPLNKDGRNWIILPNISKPIISPPSVISNARLTYFIFRILKIPFREYKILKTLGLSTPGTPDFIHDYELRCLEWYVDEIYAMTEIFRKKFNNIHYMDIDIETLNDPDRVMEFFATLNLTPNHSITEIVGSPSNQREQLSGH